MNNDLDDIRLERLEHEVRKLLYSSRIQGWSIIVLSVGVLMLCWLLRGAS